MLNPKKQAQPKAHPGAVQLQASRLTRRGLEGLNADLIQKFYFSTTSGGALPDHTQRPSEFKGAVGESMKGILPPVYIKNEFDAPKRSACTYASQFKIHSLDDAPVNKELGHIIGKNSRTGSSSNQVVEGLSLGSDTTTKAYYGSYGYRPPRIDPPRIVMPEENIKLRPDAKFLESKTQFQRDYRWKSMTQNQPCAKSVDHLGQKSPGKFNDMTSYRREFGKDQKGKHGRYVDMLNRAQSMDALQAQRPRQPAAYSGR